MVPENPQSYHRYMREQLFDHIDIIDIDPANVHIPDGSLPASNSRRTVEGEVSHDVAATYLQAHANATVYLDLAAAEDLTRIKTPWVLGPVEWTPQLTERAVVWLAEAVGKALLKPRRGPGHGRARRAGLAT